MISSNCFRSAECIKPTTRNRKASEFLKLSEQKKTSRFSSHSTWSSRPSDFSTDDLRCLLSDDLILLFNSQDTPTPEQGSWIHKGTSKNNEMIRHIVLGFSAEMGKLTATHFVNNWIRKGADNQSQDQYYGQQVELLNFPSRHGVATTLSSAALSSSRHHFST